VVSSLIRFPRVRPARPRAVAAVIALAGSGLVAVAAPADANSAAAPAGGCSARAGHSAQIRLHDKVIAVGARAAHLSTAGRCAPVPATGQPGAGAPPLYYFGGRVMAVPAVGNKVVVTPIFWAPSGYSFPTGYQNLIVRYLNDVAAASGSNNIFATNTEYGGSNGVVHYGMKVNAPITDTSALPARECTVDSGPVYSDNSGYTDCIDDDQVTAETTAQISAHHLTTDLGHIFVMFTPKGVESCAFSTTEIPSGQPNQCTVNSSPTAAYCAYHSYATGHTNEIYAEMPFPIFFSAAAHRATCGSESNFNKIQSPNSNPAADVEISPLSHELSEAITDPNLSAWFDAIGFENGDECAYIYGPHGGTSGHFFNQTINGHHYLTQEEFSNADFFASYGRGGCVQGEPRPTVVAGSPASGSHKGGTVVSLAGTYFTPASQVMFGTTAGKVLKVANSGHLTVRAPAHAVGTVNVVVKTIGGTSNAISFQYK
jgi:hypothetical protein